MEEDEPVAHLDLAEQGLSILDDWLQRRNGVLLLHALGILEARAGAHLAVSTIQRIIRRYAAKKLLVRSQRLAAMVAALSRAKARADAGPHPIDMLLALEQLETFVGRQCAVQLVQRQCRVFLARRFLYRRRLGLDSPKLSDVYRGLREGNARISSLMAIASIRKVDALVSSEFEPIVVPCEQPAEPPPSVVISPSTARAHKDCEMDQELLHVAPPNTPRIYFPR
mmetsp:Transcript_53403/g.141867  ORF Transcript_53403/g.141867 Transcript_53403/m.141867 type:complete len:225 (+) Transcript_53403:43-717(+)